MFLCIYIYKFSVAYLHSSCKNGLQDGYSTWHAVSLPTPPRPISPSAPGLAQKSGFGPSTSEASKARSFSSSCSCRTPAPEQRTSAFLPSPLHQMAPPVALGWTSFSFVFCSVDALTMTTLKAFPSSHRASVGKWEDRMEGRAEKMWKEPLCPVTSPYPWQ